MYANDNKKFKQFNSTYRDHKVPLVAEQEMSFVMAEGGGQRESDSALSTE